MTRGRRLLLAALWLAALWPAACNTRPVPDPAAAQAQAALAWRQDQHGIWELSWPQAPLAGPLIFEAWFAGQGVRRRFEILQAPAPALVGLVYVGDGASARYFNRLQPATAAAGPAQSLPFSPIGDAFDAVSRALAQPAQSVEQPASLWSNADIQEYRFAFAGDTTLTVWLDARRNLIVRARLQSPAANLTLAARSLELLPEPHPRLFAVDEP